MASDFGRCIETRLSFLLQAACAVARIASVRYRTQCHLLAQSRPGVELRQIFQLLLGADIGKAVDRDAACRRRTRKACPVLRSW